MVISPLHFRRATVDAAESGSRRRCAASQDALICLIFKMADQKPSKLTPRCSARCSEQLLPHLKDELCALSSFAIIGHRAQVVAHLLPHRTREFENNLLRESFLKAPSSWRPYAKGQKDDGIGMSIASYSARYSDLGRCTRVGHR